MDSSFIRMEKGRTKQSEKPEAICEDLRRIAGAVPARAGGILKDETR